LYFTLPLVDVVWVSSASGMGDISMTHYIAMQPDPTDIVTCLSFWKHFLKCVPRMCRWTFLSIF